MGASVPPGAGSASPVQPSRLCFNTLRQELQPGWGDPECDRFISLALRLWPKAALGPSPRCPVSLTSEGWLPSGTTR